MVLDFALAVLVPPFWTYFWFCRWSGKVLSAREFWFFLRHGLPFAIEHLRHRGGGTGALSVDWSSPPVRSCQGRERVDHFPRGSCGTCKNCCTTNWLPEKDRLTCPYLTAQGCSIYGGIYWDYFNCGRYPSTPSAVDFYACPRFEGITKRPVVATPAVAASANGAPRRRKLVVV